MERRHAVESDPRIKFNTRHLFVLRTEKYATLEETLTSIWVPKPAPYRNRAPTFSASPFFVNETRLANRLPESQVFQSPTPLIEGPYPRMSTWKSRLPQLPANGAKDLVELGECFDLVT